MNDNLSTQSKATRHADRLELVFQAYERSLDLDIALTIVPMSDEDREALINDPLLQARIALCDAKACEELITDLRLIAKTSLSDSVRFSAIKELGKTIYPKRFKEEGAIAASLPNRILYEEVESSVC